MDIEQRIQDFKETFLPEKFEWRRGQKEAIKQIVETYFEGKYKIVVLDAPVGSGKSIIAMAVSWILNKRDKNGYILASDITLQEQYEKDFKSMNLNWGSVKGIDNYDCNDNGERLSMGTCKIRNKRPRSMPCYNDCQYYSARDKASDSETSLLNYAYWLIMMNYVQGSIENPPFETRDFMIADEAHKIVDIVQSHYSPKFDKLMNRKFERLTNFFNDHNMKNHDLDFVTLKNLITQLETSEVALTLFDILKKIEIILRSYLRSVSVLKDKVDKEYKSSEPPKKWKAILKTGDWLKDFHCKIEDYIEIIDKTSIDHLIKNPNGEDIVFNCLFESYLMHKYFHKWSDFTVLMSATFADPKEYLRSIAISGAKYIKMESNFNFTKSPIYFYNKRKMSYSQIDANLPWLNKTINSIIFKHKGERGVIHTASYHLAMKIWDGLSKQNKNRVLVYSGTEEKRQVLEQLKRFPDKILMGPSLLEGIDLKDDWSRFQIFAKVPYLSLGDRFVKAKMDRNPAWYRNKAVIAILQGTGRSVRSETDWAVTYILDGALSDLIHRSPAAFPVEFRSRVKLIRE